MHISRRFALSLFGDGFPKTGQAGFRNRFYQEREALRDPSEREKPASCFPHGEERLQRMKPFAVLRENHEFRRVYARGKSYAHPALITYVMKNRAGFCRMGITTSAKIGGAVQRNRARRCIREAYRQIYPQLQGGYDLVFVARSRTCQVKSTDILRVMKGQLGSAGLLGPKPASSRTGTPPRSEG